jgi:hypothetical protein
MAILLGIDAMAAAASAPRPQFREPPFRPLEA